MKNISISSLLLLGIAIVSFGCSKDDSEQVEPTVAKVHTITFGSSTTKTSTSGTTVTWTTGDKIGIMKVGDTSTNYCFVLTSGAGASTATFTANTKSDDLDAGATYVAYYPYKEGTSRYTASVGTLSSQTSTSFLKDNDLLTSDQFSVSAEGVTNPSIVAMNHVFSLIEYRVKLNAAASITSPDFQLHKIFFGVPSGDTSTPFASSVSLASSVLDPTFTFNQSTIAVEYTTPIKLTSNYQSFWMMVRQDQNGGAHNFLFEAEVYSYYDGTHAIGKPGITKSVSYILGKGEKRSINLIVNANLRDSGWTLTSE